MEGESYKQAVSSTRKGSKGELSRVAVVPQELGSKCSPTVRDTLELSPAGSFDFLKNIPCSVSFRVGPLPHNMGSVDTGFYLRIGVSCFFPHSFQSRQEDQGG